MRAPAKTGDSIAPAAPLPTLRARLRAWWEGYDLPEPRPAAGAAGIVASHAISGDASAPGDALSRWPPARRRLVQLLWGEGFNLPGGADRFRDLVAPFALDGEGAILEIGAGLGGGTRLLATETGTRVSAHELDPGLAGEATRISADMGLKDKATVAAFDPDEVQFRHGFFDGCLIRESLMEIADKDALLESAVGALRPECALVISDIFITGDEPGPRARDCLDLDLGAGHPCPPERIGEKLAALELDIRTAADETPEYMAIVRRGWSELAETLETLDPDPDLAAALKWEADLWTRRMLAMSSGELAVHRFVAVRKAAEE